jgi:putative Holliday junction resolvase
MTQYVGRVLAIDYGSKRVGIAVSDPMRIIAQGVTTLDSDSRLIENIAALLREHEVALVLVGMPYSADGGKGAKALEVERFIDELKKVVAIQIDTWDESCTSVNAQRAFIDGGMKRKKRQEKKRVDEMAARLMLQEYLDTTQHSSAHSG